MRRAKSLGPDTLQSFDASPAVFASSMSIFARASFFSCQLRYKIDKFSRALTGQVCCA